MKNIARAESSPRPWVIGSTLGAVAALALLTGAQACSSAQPAAMSDISNVMSGQVSGPCPTEGATMGCRVETGRDDTIANCFVGTQTCHQGVWSACGATGGTTSTVDLSAIEDPESSGGVGIRAVTASEPSAKSAGCKANPCNADCMGIDVDAGALRPEGGSPTTTDVVVASAASLTDFPTAKQRAQATPTCGLGSPAAGNQVCSYDYCCAGDTTTGTCQRWSDKSASAKCKKASGADYTTGIGCEDPTGAVHIPVCNRGSTDSPATGKLLLAGYPGNLNAAGSASVCTNLGTSPSEACIIDLAIKRIKAGECVDVDVTRGAAGTQPGVKCASAADFGSGNRASMVNPAGPTNLPASLVGAYGAATYTQLAETDKCNNQSFVHTQLGSCKPYEEPLPPPVTHRFTYKMACLPGFRAVWTQLGYSTTVPATSRVTFAARTAPPLSDGGVGAWTAPVPVADVTDSGGDPALCLGSGTGCPKNLFTILGSTAKYDPTLELAVTLTSTSAIPTVNGWQVSYSCVPVE